MNHLQIPHVHPCGRRNPHASHTWVASPSATVDQLCPGRSRALGDVLALVDARPELAEVGVGVAVARGLVSAA